MVSTGVGIVGGKIGSKVPALVLKTIGLSAAGPVAGGLFARLQALGLVNAVGALAPA